MRADDAVPTTKLRVLTVNIHKGYTALRRRSMLHDLREALRSAATDLVMLQEVQGASPRGDHDAVEPFAGQAEYLADQVWRDHAYARNAVVQRREHGNAVLSRWPIVRTVNHDVSLPGAEPRGLLHCVIDLSGTLLHAICVHLGLRESHRRSQLKRLRDVVHALPDGEPLVVAGDFNDWRSRADSLLGGSGLHNVHRAAFGRSVPSFPARWPVLALDRVYVRRVAAHRPLALPRRPWSHLSDHAPVGAEIQLES